MKEDLEHKSTTNKKQKRLTVSELRNFKGLDHLSEDEAENAISTLEKFSLLMFEMYKKEKALKENLKAMNNNK